MIYLEKQTIVDKYIFERVRLFIYQTMCLQNHVLRKNFSYVIFNKFKKVSLYKSDEVHT